MLDKYRAPLLGSAVRYPFRLLAMYNGAYCMLRSGNGEGGREPASKVLALASDMINACELMDMVYAGRAMAQQNTAHSQASERPNSA